MRPGTTCTALAIFAGSTAIADAGRYELIPQQDIHQTQSNNRVASAYVIDKKASQFWICTARYNFQDLTANQGGLRQASGRYRQAFAERGLRGTRRNGLGRDRRLSSDILVHRTRQRRDTVLRYTSRRAMRANEVALTSAQRRREGLQSRETIVEALVISSADRRRLSAARRGPEPAKDSRCILSRRRRNTSSDRRC
jgi:hypothetical protein